MVFSQPEGSVFTPQQVLTFAAEILPDLQNTGTRQDPLRFENIGGNLQMGLMMSLHKKRPVYLKNLVETAEVRVDANRKEIVLLKGEYSDIFPFSDSPAKEVVTFVDKGFIISDQRSS